MANDVLRPEALDRIGAGVVLGDDVTIGDDVVLHPNVTVLERCLIGNRVIIHSGTVIGSDGFGFAPDGKTYHKQPHTGIVRIADDVEIGANNTVDRATFGETRIGCGVKTDNLVQIAHNVHIGDHTAMAAGVGIAGSTHIGSRCLIAGMVGIAGHIEIVDNVTILGKCMVSKSLTKPGAYASMFPVEEARTWSRRVASLRRLDKLQSRVSALEKKDK